MICKPCGRPTRCIESRPAAYGRRRRYFCKQCHGTQSTVEIDAQDYTALRRDAAQSSEALANAMQRTAAAEAVVAKIASEPQPLPSQQTRWWGGIK